MPDDRAIVQLQKIADATDMADPQFEFVARHCLRIRPALAPRAWEYVMAYRALDQADMLRGERRGISFGSGREPLIFAVAMRAGFLCVTDFYTGSTTWDTARTEDPRDFVLAVAHADFDPSRIEVRSMDMRQIEHPDHSFDFAYSISALEHIGFDDDFVRHLREIRRVLKPNGVYVLTTELRIRGESLRVEGNHAFDLDHLLRLFREAGLCIEPHFDARLADRIENEGRELLDTRYHDVSNPHTELLMVREFGGITSVPALFILRPGTFEEVEVVGLAETASWLQQRLDLRVNLSYSDWVTLNPYGMLIGALSPYCDLWRGQSAPTDPLMFATAYKYFGSGEMEVRVTIVTSPETASSGIMLLCINSWSLNDSSDVASVVSEQVEIISDEILARRFVFRIDAVGDRSYSVFAAKVSGEIWLSDVVVVARRASGEPARKSTDHSAASPRKPLAPPSSPWQRLAARWSRHGKPGAADGLSSAPIPTAGLVELAPTIAEGQREQTKKLNLVDEIASKLGTLYNEIASSHGMRKKLTRIDAELRQLQLGVDFVRTRLSCYVGDGIVLTYLADETPIFVNSNDMGGPFNLMNGGRYEEENLAVLLSFVNDDTVFLDIGANVGFYTLKIGRRLGINGKVYAFEPHPKMSDLLARNIHVNGLGGKINCFRFALSDTNATATLQYPAGHLGGGHIDAPGDIFGHTAVDAEIRRLDDVLGPDFRCDLVKIDVEGHEINVLRGMKNIVTNSPAIKILFEKLVPEAGTEAALESYFSELGLDLYGVQPDASLIALGAGEIAGWSGYILASRPGAIEGGLKRSRFSVPSGQLLAPAATAPSPGVLRSAAEQGGMLFHGPYWYLPTGVWRFKFHGNIRGAVRFKLLERFGHPVLDFSLQSGESEHVFVVRRDLVYFECAAYAAANQAEVTVERLEFIREG